MLYVDELFAKQLPLSGFQLKGSGRYFANFRCPICGDSKKSKAKKRAYFERHDGELKAHCYNCGYHAGFRYFLKQNFPDYYTDYLKEAFKSTGTVLKTVPKKVVSVKFLSNTTEKLDLQTIAELPRDHRAAKYVRERMVPEKFWNDIYYTDNFMQWAHSKQPDKFEKPSKQDKRILFVMRNKDNSIIGVSARTITNAIPKYLTMKFNDDDLKIFGLERVNVDKDVYVLEGPLDSLFLANSVAVVGATSGIQKLTSKDEEGTQTLPKERLVIIADNEPRSKQTTGFIEQALKAGLKVVLWPTTWPFKDLNEAIMNGKTEDHIRGVVEQNVVSGPLGMVRLKLWRKV